MTTINRIKRFALGGIALFAMLAFVGVTANAQSTSIVISQFQVTGDNPTANPERDEFIEFKNISGVSYTLNGQRVVYRPAGSTDATQDVLIFTFGAGSTILAGQYALLGSSDYNDTVTRDGIYLTGPGQDFPNGALASAGGSIALLGDNPATTAVEGATNIIDAVGYGTGTATAFTEGTPTDAPTANNSRARSNNGCTDTNNNAADFVAQTPSAPRNLASPRFICTVANAQLIISEFRLSGPAGEFDEYYEVHNPTDAALTVTAIDGTAGFSIRATRIGADATSAIPTSTTGQAVSAAEAVCIIANGVIIPARGFYLCTNNGGGGYSLSAAAAQDAQVQQAVPLNSGLALFRSSTNATLTNRLDAVGPAGQANTTGTNLDESLYVEGTGYAPINGPAVSVEYSFVRQTPSGAISPGDTQNNSVDFITVNTTGANVNGVNTRRLGSPGPQNLNGVPANANSTPRTQAQITVGNADVCVAGDQPQNRVRNRAISARDPINANLGNFDQRLSITNNTAAALTSVRLRFNILSTFPTPNDGTADIRLLSSPDINVAVRRSAADCTSFEAVTAEATFLEIPTSPTFGGGVNATLSFPEPIAVGETRILNVRFGVQNAGSFRFGAVVEGDN